MMIYMICGVVIVTVFLFNLNTFLRGTKQPQLDLALRLIALGSVIASFFVSNWIYGIITICIGLVSHRITRPFAARIASKLLSAPEGKSDKYIGLPPKSLEQISKDLDMGMLTDPNEMDEIMDRADAAEDALLDYCESQSAVRAVMEEFQVSRDDLRQIYSQLINAGAGQWSCGHWVPASALGYPQSLKYVLSRRDKDVRDTAFNLIMYFEHGTFGIEINGRLVDSSSSHK
jgi:hypothetical protein